MHCHSRNQIILFLVLHLLIPTILSSQTLTEKISKEICTCINKQNDSTIDASFIPCYQKSTKKYQKEMMESVDFNSGISPSELGRMIGKEMMLNVTENMVYTCDDYFEWFERIKLRIFQIEDIDITNQTILDLSQVIKSNPNDELALMSRGYQYLKLKDFKSAQKDLKRVLKLNPNNALSLIYLGMTYEYSGYLKKSIDYYARASELTDKQEILIYKFIAIRKK